MAVRTNRQILTQGQKYVKKQSKKFGTEELTFDKESRVEFLTGFHKRKLQRQKKAQEFVKEQERLVKIEERKKVRDERKQQFEQQMKDFKEGLDLAGDLASKTDSSDDDDADFGKKIIDEEDSDDEEWTGIEEDDRIRPILKKNIIDTTTYNDETTVEIESLEPNENFQYLARMNNVRLEKSEKILDQSITRATKYAKFLGMSTEEEEAAPKKKKKSKKKFRYLTKNERRMNQKKANDNKRRK